MPEVANVDWRSGSLWPSSSILSINVVATGGSGGCSEAEEFDAVAEEFDAVAGEFDSATARGGKIE
jgi:hypothetical protein